MHILKWVEAGRLESLEWARQVANWKEGVQQTQEKNLFWKAPRGWARKETL